MELLVNDLSLHGQFSELKSFRNAIQQIMKIRQVVRRFSRELYCHRNLTKASITPTITMPQAIQVLKTDERRAFMQWLTQYGPFWEDVRNHVPDDWFECNGNIVTNTAVGETAWCCLHDIEQRLVSFIPSDWQFSPVSVDWRLNDTNRKTVDVVNYWEPDTIEAFLQNVPVLLASWEQLEVLTKARCNQLTFAVNAFNHLHGHPFALSAAKRLYFILEVLNNFKSCFDTSGELTTEGHEIYRNFFTGKKEGGGRGSLFSDSSDSEKKEFKSEMTFGHPADANKTLFCPWHGKVQTPQLRVHFSWPVRADEPLYVVYVGPKRTKR